MMISLFKIVLCVICVKISCIVYMFHEYRFTQKRHQIISFLCTKHLHVDMLTIHVPSCVIKGFDFFLIEMRIRYTWIFKEFNLYNFLHKEDVP